MPIAARVVGDVLVVTLRAGMLSPGLLELLRTYWREARPEGWLSPVQPKINRISPRQLNCAFTSTKHMAGVKKAATLHTSRRRCASGTLRHSFATHQLEANTPSCLMT